MALRKQILDAIAEVTLNVLAETIFQYVGKIRVQNDLTLDNLSIPMYVWPLSHREQHYEVDADGNVYMMDYDKKLSCHKYIPLYGEHDPIIGSREAITRIHKGTPVMINTYNYEKRIIIYVGQEKHTIEIDPDPEKYSHGFLVNHRGNLYCYAENSHITEDFFQLPVLSDYHRYDESSKTFKFVDINEDIRSNGEPVLDYAEDGFFISAELRYLPYKYSPSSIRIFDNDYLLIFRDSDSTYSIMHVNDLIKRIPSSSLDKMEIYQSKLSL